MGDNEYTTPNGYIIQLYQYALRYMYNNPQLLAHFNKQITNARGKSTKDEDYTALGDFDLLEINSVYSFRQYHDVSDFAKGWVGKRQCMLLYDISDKEMPIRLVYEKREKRWESFWESRIEKYASARRKKFFCLSMFSLTNQVTSICPDGFSFLRIIRHKILSIIDVVNEKLPGTDICCEVFGTFNTSEIAVIWLADEYVDTLHLLDYFKHMTIKVSGESDSVPVFMTTFSVITMRSNLEPTDEVFNMKGDALIQFSFNDENTSYEKLGDIKSHILEYCADDEQLENYDSAGEYDWAVRCSARHLLKMICPKNRDDFLHVGIRVRGSDGKSCGQFDENQECRAIIRNNTRLLVGKNDNSALLGILNSLSKEGQFELDATDSVMIMKPFHGELLSENRDFYYKDGGLRDKLKKRIKAATGTVDTMDLLVTDYQSVISSTYSKTWAEDMHCQFSAVLHAIDELVENDDIDFWESYRDVTNSFKQQVNHLTQSNRLFFEIPSTHLRATGHYDFLMHAYYGITKRIIEAVYLMQGNDAQSELVPLLTINTEPQVKSNLFFDFEKDTVRTMNLVIPNSILTDPYRGIIYLSHEMFHYAVPQDRSIRNYKLGVFFLSMLFRPQMLSVLKSLLKKDCPPELLKKVDEFLSMDENESGNQDAMRLLLLPYAQDEISFDEELKLCVQCSENYRIFEEKCFSIGSEKSPKDLKDSYLHYLEEYAASTDSDELFNRVFPVLFKGAARRFKAFKDILEINNPELHGVVEWIGSRFDYYRVQEESTLIEMPLGSQDILLLREARSFRIAFLKLDQNTDQDFPYIRKARNLAKALDEAHSDIAAITLCDIPMTDYVLFFIRNIVELDRQEIFDIREIGDDVILRFALVVNYCRWKEISTFPPHSSENPFSIFNTDDLAYFKKMFSWIFMPDKSRAISVNDESLLKKYEYLACRWIDLIETMLFEYNSVYAKYFKEVFLPIIETADVNKRMNDLKSSKRPEMVEYGNNLERIQSEFKGILDTYAVLFKNYPKIKGGDIGGYRRVTNDRFHVDLKTLHTFQNQPSLIELQEKNQKIIEQHNIFRTDSRNGFYISERYNPRYLTNYEWRFDVYNWNELQEYLRFCKQSFDKRLASWNMDNRIYSQLWYRGQTSSDEERYRLWPTLVRNIQNSSSQDKYLFQSYVRYQRTQLDLFKTLVDGAPEVPHYSTFSSADYVALMQHYGLDTNLVDFTDNAFIALYLALKYYSNDTKDGDAKKRKRDVTIYLLNPVIYNRFRYDTILSQIDALNLSNDEREKAMNTYGIEKEGGLYGFLPNISTRHNEELYARYIFGKPQLDKKSHYELDGEVIRALPVAMWTPRLNHRIRAQSGSFVAFDLYADVKDERYTLERLQDEEVKRNKSNDPCIFLYKLTISRSCCQDIHDTLRTMGITRQFVYPEIESAINRFK